MSPDIIRLDVGEVEKYLSEKLDGLNESQVKRAEELGIPVVSEDSAVLGQNHIAERIRWAQGIMKEIDSIFDKYDWNTSSDNDDDDGFIIKDPAKRIGILKDIKGFYDRNRAEWDRIDGLPIYAPTDKGRREYAAMIPLIKFYQAFPELAYKDNTKIDNSKRENTDTFIQIIKIAQNCTRYLGKDNQESLLKLALSKAQYTLTQSELEHYYNIVAESNPESDFSIFCFDGIVPDQPGSVVHIEELIVSLDGNSDEFLGKIKIPPKLALLFIRKHLELFKGALGKKPEKGSAVYWFSKLCPQWNNLAQKIVSENKLPKPVQTKVRTNKKQKLNEGPTGKLLANTGNASNSISLQEVSHERIRLGGLHADMTIGVWIREIGQEGILYEVTEKDADGFNPGLVIEIDRNKEYEVKILVDEIVVGDGSWSKIKSASLDYVRRHSPLIKEAFLKTLHTKPVKWSEVINIPVGVPNDINIFIEREGTGVSKQLDLSQTVDIAAYPPGKYSVSFGFDRPISDAKRTRLSIPEKNTVDISTQTGTRVVATLPTIPAISTAKNKKTQVLTENEDLTDEVCLTILEQLESGVIEKLGKGGYTMIFRIGDDENVCFVMDDKGELGGNYEGPRNNINITKILDDLGTDIKKRLEEFRVGEEQEIINKKLGYFVGIEGFLSAGLRGVASLDKQEKNLIDAVPGDVRGTLGNLYINNRYYSGLRLLVQKGIIDAFISECKNQGVHIKIVRSNDSGVEDAKGTELSISISIAGEQGIAGTLLTKQNAYPVLSQRGDIESKIYERLQDLLLNIVYLLGKVGMLSHSQGVTEYKGKKITDAEIRDILAGKCGFPKHQEWKVMEKAEKEEIRELYARFQKGFGKKVIKEGFGVSTGYYEYTITGRHDISGIADDDTIVVRDERIQGVKEGDTSRWNPDIYTVLEKNQRLRIALIYRMRATVDGGVFERKSKLTNGMKSCFDHYWAGLDPEVRDDFLKSFDKKKGGDGMKGIEFINPRTGEKIIDEFIGLLRDTNERVLSLTDGGVYVKYGQVPLRYNSPYTISGSAFREYIKEIMETGEDSAS